MHQFKWRFHSLNLCVFHGLRVLLVFLLMSNDCVCVCVCAFLWACATKAIWIANIQSSSATHFPCANFEFVNAVQYLRRQKFFQVFVHVFGNRHHGKCIVQIGTCTQREWASATVKFPTKNKKQPEHSHSSALSIQNYWHTKCSVEIWMQSKTNQVISGCNKHIHNRVVGFCSGLVPGSVVALKCTFFYDFIVVGVRCQAAFHLPIWIRKMFASQDRCWAPFKRNMILCEYVCICRHFSTRAVRVLCVGVFDKRLVLWLGNARYITFISWQLKCLSWSTC